MENKLVIDLNEENFIQNISKSYINRELTLEEYETACEEINGDLYWVVQEAIDRVTKVNGIPRNL